MGPRSETAQRELDRLARALTEERHESRRRTDELLRTTSLVERAKRGVALVRPTVDEIEPAPGGRLRMWLVPGRGIDLDDLRIRSGDPIRLSWPDSDERPVRAIASRRDATRLSIVVDADVPDAVLEGGFAVDVETPEVTFDRGAAAIERARRAKPESALGRLVEVALGDDPPRFGALPDVGFFDAASNDSQRLAIRRALAESHVSLVHGPPGTGKTRTLVELIRRCVANGEKLLVCAPSHAALDTLGERLLAANVPLVRIGHPARASEAMEDATLDARIAASDARKLSRRFVDEAAALRKRASRMTVRGKEDREERRAAYSEARALDRDARAVLDVEAERQLARARVVLSTLAAADDRSIADLEFDRVVIDEATQSIDPLVLIPLGRAPRAVLAGDPEQLPPTVISRAAIELGLESTIFERLRARYGEPICTTLDVQHRMHEALALFPNVRSYGGVLKTAEEARQRDLRSLGALDDPSRPSPFTYLDTAGRGWEEEREAEDASTANPGQAERTANEVRRLVSRGIDPASIGLITPYEAHARRLRGLLASERAKGLEIGTVDGFQGREKEVIVVDLVRSNPEGAVGFLAEIRRTNVAITRAKRQLVVIGDSATLGAHPYYAAFVDHATATAAYVSAWDDEGDPLA